MAPGTVKRTNNNIIIILYIKEYDIYDKKWKI